MSFSNILLAGFCVVFSVVLNDVRGDTVVNGKTYVIRSSMDGGYLRPLGDGKVCETLSRIIAIYRGNTNPFPDEYKWLVREDVINYKFQLLNEGPGAGHSVNEITFGDYPPFCYLVYRDIDLVPNASNTAYQIINVADGKCLSHYGSEVGIMFWQNCGGSGVAQGWIFEETTPVDKYTTK